jgi:hypothetical protein
MVSTDRRLALDEAVKLHQGSFDEMNTTNARAQVIATAVDFYGYLVGPASISLEFGPILDQNTDQPTGRNGSAMAQLHDNEKMDLSFTAADAKGANVPDDPSTTSDDATWVSSDTTVFTYVVDPATPRSAIVVAGLPGSAIGTLTIGSVVATHAVDVVPAGIATISITEGTPVPQ